MSAEIQVPDGPEACGPTCAIQLLGVEVQDATRETEVTLPNRPALSCFGCGGPARSPSIGPLAPRPVHVTAVEQGDLRRPVLKAVGGEASWTTSVSTRQPTVRHRLLARRRDVVVNTLELQVAKGAPAAAGHGAIHRHRRVHRTSPRRPATGGGRSCSTTMTRAAHRLVERRGGRLIKSTGDGILAVCDTLGSNGIIDREEADHGRQAGCTGAPSLR
jgi:hypothetical protein